jgi:hypothetical protein
MDRGIGRDFMEGRPVEFPAEGLWLDRRSSGRLSDLPLCDGSFYIASSRFVDIIKPYMGHSVSAERIEVRHSRISSEWYFYLKISRGAGDYDRSMGWPAMVSKGLVGLQAAREGGESVCGFYFDLNTWDGSDIFRMGRSSYMVVTDRVAHAVASGGLVGVSLVRLDRFGCE